MDYVRLSIYERMMTASVLRHEAADVARLALSAPEDSMTRRALQGIAERHREVADRLWPEPGKQLTTHTGGQDG